MIAFLSCLCGSGVADLQCHLSYLFIYLFVFWRKGPHRYFSKFVLSFKGQDLNNDIIFEGLFFWV